jgi:hypothetical protein
VEPESDPRIERDGLWLCSDDMVDSLLIHDDRGRLSSSSSNVVGVRLRVPVLLAEVFRDCVEDVPFRGRARSVPVPGRASNGVDTEYV